MDVHRIIFFTFLLLAQVTGFAQDNILKRKINYNASNQKLESALLGIANVGDFSFSYNPATIPGDSLVDLNISNSTVKDVLDIIFQKTIVYKVSGNHLILLKEKPNKVREDITYSVSGYVYDAQSGKQLPNTTVYEVYTLSSTVTDENGYYSFSISKKFDEFGLAYSKRDFVDTLVLVQPLDHQLNITLRQKWTQAKLDARDPVFETSVKPVDNIPIVQKFVPEGREIASVSCECHGFLLVQIKFSLSDNRKCKVRAKWKFE